MRQTIENLRQKPESYRHKFAFYTALSVTLVIFASWSLSNGVINIPDRDYFANKKVESEAQAASVAQAPSPLENSKSAFDNIFSGIKSEFKSLQESLADVFVPFVSGIEVYESE